jgi:parallel beta-helix repeat protein/predicted outer membrane repeat protein
MEKIMMKFKGKSRIALLSAVMAILFLSAPRSFAEVIFISGDVSGVWSADSVIVTDSVRVPAGETLTIMPGVDILFTSYYKFQVLDNAVLHAVGTETDSIRFLPFTQGDRTLGLDFLGASSQSILEYCYISDALTSAVHCSNSDITIRNSLFENNEAPTGSLGGGGIELVAGSNAIIEYNTIRNNYSTGEGGAIYCSASSPIIKGNIIMGNLAGYYGDAAGGGIACFNGSNPQITGNRITNNSVNPSGSFTVRHGYGGGVYISNSTSAVISSNIITANVVDSEPQTTTDGGGIYLHNADVTISNNVIANNMAQGNDGGGIHMYASFPVLVNNTIAYNMAGDFGGAIFAEFSDPDIVNSILYFNQDSTGMQIYETGSTVTVTYSDIQGTYPGMGNIDVVPFFRSPFGGDYRLQDSIYCGDDFYSSCIDAGSPDYTDSLVDCSFGLGTEASDMGAYGGGLLSPTGISDNFESVPSDFRISRSYPNPFNAVTTISYSLTESSNIRIDVFDALGRKIETLFDGYREAGEHNVSWNASEVSSGTYFYRIQADDYFESRKMLLLK